MISNKLIGLAALAFLCGSAGFTAVGCTSTVTQSGGDDDDDAGPTTSSSSGGRTRPDGGNTSGDGGEEPGACYAAGGALAYDITTPTLGTRACPETGWADFLAACASEASTEAGCTAFVDAPCGTCILGSEPNTKAAPPAFIAGTSILINVQGCLAAVAGADEECIQAASSTGLCVYEGSCRDCDGQKNKADFDACVEKARTVDCKPISDAAEACITAAAAGKDAQLAASCASDADDFDKAAVKIVRTFCGTGPTPAGDGGTVLTDAGRDAN